MIYTITFGNETWYCRASPDRIHHVAATAAKGEPYEVKEVAREKNLRQSKAGRKLLRKLEAGI